MNKISLLILSAIVAFTLPAHAQFVPGSSGLVLGSDKRPTSDVRLDSPHWIGALADTNLSPKQQSAATAAATLYVSNAGNDTLAQRGTTLPYATLSAAVAAATSGDHIVVQAGTYSYAGTVTIPAGVNNVVLDGYGAKIIAQNTSASAADSHKINVAGSNCVVRGFEIVGSPAGQSYAGTAFPDAGMIEVSGPNTVVEECNIHDTVSAAIRLVATYDHSRVSNNLITNARIGVTLAAYNANVDGVMTEGNICLNCVEGAYRSELQQGYIVSHEQVLNNIITNTGPAYSLGIELAGAGNGAPATCSHQMADVSGNMVSGYAYGISLNSVNVGTIDRNLVSNCNFIGIELVLSFNLSASHDWIDSAAGCGGFSLDRSQFPANPNAYFSVRDCTVVNQNTSSAVHVYYTNHAIISNCDLYGNSTLIWDQVGQDVTIQGNRLHMDNSQRDQVPILIFGRGGNTTDGYFVSENKITHNTASSAFNNQIGILQDGSGSAVYTHFYAANNYTDATVCPTGFFACNGTLTNPVFLNNYPVADGAHQNLGFPLSQTNLTGVGSISGTGDGTAQITSYAPLLFPYGTDGNFAVSVKAGYAWYNGMNFYTHDGYLAAQISYCDPSKSDQGLYDTLSITSRNGGDVLVGTTPAPGSTPATVGPMIRVPTGSNTQTNTGGIIQQTSTRFDTYIALSASASAPTGVPGALAWFWCDTNGDMHVHHSNGKDDVISAH